MRPEASKWVHGDIVVRGDSTGVVRQLRRQHDGAPYFKIEVVSGGSAGSTWDWPEGWRPQLDVGDNPTMPCICAECGREFKAPDAGEVLCRTCDEMGLAQRTLEEKVGGNEGRLRSRLRRVSD